MMLTTSSNRLLYQSELSWDSLITSYIKSGNIEKAFAFYGEQQKDVSVSISGHTYVALLQACGKCKDLKRGLEIHDKVDVLGLLKSDVFIGNSLIDMYAKCGSLEKAQQVFDTLLVRDVVSWTSLISGYSEHGHGEEALNYFKRMRVEAMSPNSVTILCIVKACVSIGAVDKGEAIHAEVEGSILYGRDLAVWNTLIDMYIKCGLLSKACVLFDSLSVHNVVSWTTLISGYTDNGLGEEALKCFEQMQMEGIFPDVFTFACSFKACASVGSVRKGEEIHVTLGEKGLERDIFLCNALIDMYAKNGYFTNAQELLYKIQVPEVVSWTTLISGYAECGLGDQALKCFEQMQFEGVLPNSATFCGSLQACCHMRNINTIQGIHAKIAWMGILDKDIVILNTLLGTYIKCKSLVKAQKVFERTCVRDVVIWTTLVAGYIEYGDGNRALQCLEQMQRDAITPDIVTLVFSLKACGCLGDQKKIEIFHSEMVEKGLDQEVVAASTLVDIYAKCGMLVEAQDIFEKLPFQGVASWNALIGGYAEQGDGEKALEYYDRMVLLGVPPDSYTKVSSLKACSDIGYLDKGREIHTEIMKKGYMENSGIGNMLVDFYGQCGLVYIAQRIFDKLQVKDIVSWNALITAYAEFGHAEEALACLRKMQLGGITPNAITYTSILKVCVSIGSTESAKEIHDEIEKEGLLEKDIFIGNSLVDMYAKCGLLTKAKQVFNKLPVLSVVSWTALIAGYSEHEHCEEALKCFQEMHLHGISPNSVTFICSLKACGSLRAIEQGQEIHSHITSKGLLEKNLVIGNGLIDMYAKCACLAEAYEVFEKLLVRNVVSWTALIAACVECGQDDEALKCFEKMRQHGISPDASTFIYCLRACGSIGAKFRGFEIHAEIERMGLQDQILVSLIDMYAKCGRLATAHQVFSKLSVRNVVSWNALIAGFAEHGDAEEVLRCIGTMWLKDVFPNTKTFVHGLKACQIVQDMGSGRVLHAEIEGETLMAGDLIGNSLIEMYASCGALEEAQEVFNHFPTHDVVSWTVLISAYTEHENGVEALNCFSQMQTEGVPPDLITFVCTLKACGDVGAKEKGLELHAEIERKGFSRQNLSVCNTLVNMYAKCGLILEAQKMFESLNVRDVVSWNALMTGYVELGDSETVFQSFDTMLQQGFKPDEVTFLVILNACRHMGLFDKYQSYLESMSQSYGIDPTVEHVTGMVDSLCHSGQLDVAVEIIERMPSPPNLVMWRSVLSMCKWWGNTTIGREAFDKTICLGINNSIDYPLR